MSAAYPPLTNAAAVVDFPAPEWPRKATARPSTATALPCRQGVPRRWSRKPRIGPSRHISTSPAGTAAGQRAHTRVAARSTRNSLASQ